MWLRAVENYEWKPWDIETNLDDNCLRVSIPTPAPQGYFSRQKLGHLEYGDEKHASHISSDLSARWY